MACVNLFIKNTTAAELNQWNKTVIHATSKDNFLCTTETVYCGPSEHQLCQLDKFASPEHLQGFRENKGDVVGRSRSVCFSFFFPTGEGVTGESLRLICALVGSKWGRLKKRILKIAPM